MAVDIDDVEANGLNPGSLQRKPLTSKAPDSLLLLWPNRKNAGSEALRCASLDLDEGSHLRSSSNESNGNQVELTSFAVPVPLNDRVSVLGIPTSSCILAETAKSLIMSCHDEPSRQNSELGVARHQMRCDNRGHAGTSGSSKLQRRTQTNTRGCRNHAWFPETRRLIGYLSRFSLILAALPTRSRR